MDEHKRYQAVLTGLAVFALGVGFGALIYALVSGRLVENEWVIMAGAAVSAIAGMYFLVVGLIMMLASRNTDWRSAAHSGASDIVSALIEGLGKLVWVFFLLGLAIIAIVAGWTWLSTVLQPTAIILGSLLLLILIALMAVYARLGDVVAALKAKAPEG